MMHPLYVSRGIFLFCHLNVTTILVRYSMVQTVSDDEEMPALRLEFFKNLCKHQAAQISDLNAQVATQQQHIAGLEAYISRLQAKVVVCILIHRQIDDELITNTSVR